MPELTVAEVARLVEGEVEGEGSSVIHGVASLESAGPRDLSLVANPRYLPYVRATAAAAVLVPRGFEGELPASLTRVRVAEPHIALARLLPVLYPEPEPEPGVHPTAVIEADVRLGAGVSVGPYAVIGKGTQVGDRVRVGGHVVVGEGCVIGADCLLHPHVTLYAGIELGERCIVHSGARLGADGFGYAWMDGEHRKIPQVGGCRLGADVEIGANTTIDRGSIGDTVVGRGTKIDNLVQVGHNVRIGEKVIVVSQVGISGSTTVGDGAVLGGQVGVAGHLVIGAGARVGAQAGVTADVEPGETVSGYPARPHREALRAQAALFRLPSLVRRIRELEQKVFGR